MFRRYAPTVAAVLVFMLCLAAADWQRARMHFKQTLRAQYDAALAAPPLTNADLPRVSGDWSALRYRPVLLRGRFDAGHQILLDNKVHNGRVGYDVVAPFRLEDGRALLVDRGWVAQGRSRADLPEVPPPAGEVALDGRVELPPQGYFELGKDRTPGRVWQHLDLARLSTYAGMELLPFLVQQTHPAGAHDDGLVRAWPAPDFGIDTHRMYMLQWYAFAATTLVFWLVTHWPRRWRRRAAEARHG